MTSRLIPDGSKLPIKRMAIVIDAFSRGGAQRNLQLLIPEWLSTNIDVALFLIQNSRTELELEDLEKQGLKIVRVDATSLFDFKSFLIFLSAIRRFNPDAIYANLYWSQIWSGLVVGILRRPKLIWIEHNTYINRTRFQWNCFRLLNYFTTANLAVSVEIEEYLESKSIRNLSQIRNCARPSIRSKEGKRERSHFIFLGRLVPQKNPILALKAFELALKRKIIPKDSKLTFIGDGELLSDLRRFVEEYDIQTNVSFLGFISQVEVALTLATADCLISTSHHEGSPLARLEALSNGLCIVTTETAGISGVLTTRDNSDELIPGVFVVPANATYISEACGKSLQDLYWDESTINLRQASVVKFHPREVANSYLSILN